MRITLLRRFFLTVGLALLLLGYNQFYVQKSLLQLEDEFEMNQLISEQQILAQRLNLFILHSNFDEVRANEVFSKLQQNQNAIWSKLQVWEKKRQFVTMYVQQEPEFFPMVSTLLEDVERCTQVELDMIEGALVKYTGDTSMVTAEITSYHQDQAMRVRMMVTALSLLVIVVVLFEFLVVLYPANRKLGIAKIKAEMDREELAESNRLLQGFISSVVHDLKTPLQSALARLELISMKKKLNKDYGDDLEATSASLTRMSEMVVDILDQARGKSGVIERISLSQLLDEVKVDLSGLIRSKNATVELLGVEEIFGERLKLRLILQNLISNSIKYSRKKVEPIVRIRCNVIDNQVEIKVEDNGTGIPAQSLNEIFDMHRLDPEAAEGHGFGLPNVKKMIEEMKGSVSVQSTLGLGSSFTLNYPAPKGGQ